MIDIEFSPAVLAAIAGFLAFAVIALPLIQAIIQKPWWPEHIKRGIQSGLAVATGLVGYFAVNGFEVTTLSQLVLWVLAAVAGSTVGYKGPLGGIATAVEQATTTAPYTDAEVEAEIDLDSVIAESGEELDVPLPDDWRDDPSLGEHGTLDLDNAELVEHDRG